MKNEKMELIVNEKIVEKLAYTLLYKLACGKISKNGKSGQANLDAFNICLNKDYNGLVTLEDVSQEMYLYLIETADYWNISETLAVDKKRGLYKRYELAFTDEEICKNFYRIPSNFLYQNIRKHDRKKLWVELDNELIKIDDIPSLASHTCIDDVMTLSLYNQFISYLLTVKSKQAHRYIQVIGLRLKGYKYKDIARMLNIKETSIKKDFQILKQIWKEFNK